MIAETRLTTLDFPVFIRDPAETETPEFKQGQFASASSRCIAIRPRPEIAGEAYIALTDQVAEFSQWSNVQMVYSGILSTPSKEINVCTSTQPILWLPAVAFQTRIDVWTNHKFESNRLVVLAHRAKELPALERLISDWFLHVNWAAILLPDGWEGGRPGENIYQLGRVEFSEGNIVKVCLSQEAAVSFYNPKRIFIENMELVIALFDAAVLHRHFWGAEHIAEIETYHDGEIRFCPLPPFPGYKPR